MVAHHRISRFQIRKGLVAGVLCPVTKPSYITGATRRYDRELHVALQAGLISAIGEGLYGESR